jgi:hypothetical protein
VFSKIFWSSGPNSAGSGSLTVSMAWLSYRGPSRTWTVYCVRIFRSSRGSASSSS